MENASSPPITPRTNPYHTIVRVEPGQRTEWRIVSGAAVGVWSHFVDGSRTLPCLLPRGTCHFDHRETSSRWNCWLQVCRPGQKGIRFACLTWSAVRDCPHLLNPKTPIRGCQLYLSRSGNSPRARMHALLGFPGASREDELPEAWDVRKWLFHLWGSINLWPVGAGGEVLTELKQADIAWDNDPFARLVERGEAKL